MYAQLGGITFSGRKSFNEFSTTKESNLVELALIENKPRLQRVGMNLDVISIGMFFDSSFCIPSNEIQALNEALDSSQIMPLVMGDGTYIGDFVIKRVDVTRSNDAADGFMMQADVSVELLEYYNADRASTAVTSAISSAFATDRNKAPEYNPTATPISDETAQALLEANVLANKLDQEQDRLKNNAQLRRKVEDISRNVLVIGELMNRILQMINADTLSEVYQVTRDLAVNCGFMISDVADCSVKADSLIFDIDNGNTGLIPAKIVNLADAVKSLKRRADAIMASSARYNAYIFTQ